MSGSRSVAGSHILNNFNVTLLLVSRCLALGPVVLDGRLDGILSEHGAVKLDGWKAELLSNLGVLDLGSFVKGETFDTFSHVR